VMCAHNGSFPLQTALHAGATGLRDTNHDELSNARTPRAEANSTITRGPWGPGAQGSPRAKGPDSLRAIKWSFPGT
jgi:hypothetical protein